MCADNKLMLEVFFQKVQALYKKVNLKFFIDRCTIILSVLNFTYFC